jgi:MFS family permease
MASQFHAQNKNLKLSYAAGIFGCIMTGFTQDYFTPFILLLGGSVLQIGVLNCLNNFFSSLIQLTSAELTTKFQSRKMVTIVSIFLQVMIIFLLFILSVGAYPSPQLGIALVVGFTALGALTNPCWVSLLSDLVPPNKRGEYFGWRGRNLGLITVGSTFVAGYILHRLEMNNIYKGFAAIFLVAFMTRLIALLYMTRIKEPRLTFNKEDTFTLLKFFARIKESNFAKFTIFVAAMNFCVNLAAPFFAVFMLQDLKFNYFWYMLINIVAPLTLYLTIRRWGRHADHIGNLKILKFVAPLIGCIPLLWIINQHLIVLIGAEMFSGFLWAGFNLCSSNFIIDAVKPEKRTRCIAYFSVTNGLALASGALLGGAMIRHLPALFGYKILTLFLISSILRILAGAFLPRLLKEVRPVERVSSQQLLFSMIGIKPIAGIEESKVNL